MSATPGQSSRSDTSMRHLVIIPTYNEKDNIQKLIESIFEVVHDGLDILVVDDGSPDGTGKIVDEIAAKNPRVNAIHRTGKLGLGSAYVKGFKWALEKGYDAAIEMDADFSHNPRYLPEMIKNLAQYDFVIGSRWVSGGGTKNWGLGRIFISRGGSLYSRMILGVGIRDFTGGFNGWRRRTLLEGVNLDTITSDGYSFQIELKYRASLAGFKYVEFPIVFEDRQVGQSKMSRRIVFEALRKVWSFRLAAKKGLLGHDDRSANGSTPVAN